MSDGRDIIRHDPSEGCWFRCLSCGNWLRGRYEVRGHWALHNRGHSVFVDRKGRAYHQTVEGLQRREWDVMPPLAPSVAAMRRHVQTLRDV